MISNELLTARESELQQALQNQQNLKAQLIQKINETDASIYSISGHLTEVQHLKTLIISDKVEENKE